MIDVSTVSPGEAANDTRFKTGYLTPSVRHRKSRLIIYEKNKYVPYSETGIAIIYVPLRA